MVLVPLPISCSFWDEFVGKESCCFVQALDMVLVLCAFHAAFAMNLWARNHAVLFMPWYFVLCMVYSSIVFTGCSSLPLLDLVCSLHPSICTVACTSKRRSSQASK